MKRKRNAFAVVLLMLALITGCKKEEEGDLEKTPEESPEEEKLVEKIPYSEIPDIFFRDYLLRHFDTDMDGFISTEEAEAVKEIDLASNGKKIESLKGIEYFTSLERLYIQGIYIGDTLELNINMSLQVLDCSSTSLESLLLPDGLHLVSFKCSNTFLSSLSLNDFEFLEDLDCSHNASLMTLLLPGSKRLKTLNCNYTGISALDLKGSDDLEVLLCSESNSLQTLVLPDSKRLKYLYCVNTGGITSINLNGFNFLEVFEMYNQNTIRTVEQLDISNSSVKRILCYGLKIMNLNVNNLPDITFLVINNERNTTGIHAVDLSHSVKLDTLKFADIHSAIDVSQCKSLKYLGLAGVNSPLDISNLPTLTVAFISRCSKVVISSNPLLKELGIGGGEIFGGVPNEAEININNCEGITDLIIGQYNNQTINSINFQELKALNCLILRNSAIIYLNLSNCSALTSVHVILTKSIN